VRRELSAERRAHSQLFSQPAWFAGPKNPIGKKRRKENRRKKLASFGPLCLSSDSTPCQESESLSDLKNRRAVRPDLKLPFWTLYFRHYEVGAPCRRAYVWVRATAGSFDSLICARASELSSLACRLRTACAQPAAQSPGDGRTCVSSYRVSWASS
jgi:hypothetical protein